MSSSGRCEVTGDQATDGFCLYGGETYAHDGGIVRDDRRLVLLGRCGFFNAQILHITATEDDIFVDLVGWEDLLLGVATSAALSTKGSDILERYGGLFGVDFVQDTRVADVTL
jgi:hypothetical protein